jgi:peptidoglycan/LPS O-acetylase OafA/YrhL
MESNHQDTVKLYFDNSISKPKFKEKKSVSRPIPPNKKTTLIFQVPALATTSLRIDPGEKPGVFRIYQVNIKQDLARETNFDNKKIYNYFHCVNGNCRVSISDEFVELISDNEDLQFVSDHGLLKIPFPILIFIPIIILTFIFYKEVSKYSPEQIFSFFFPHREQPSREKNIIQPLDGLRGFAAILVLAEHTWHLFLGAGHSGVMIFFALSGFLLARPFIDNSGYLFNSIHLLQYTQRRIERILPMYIFYLLLVYGISYRIGEFILHVFFIKGLGHLWTLPQEMAFYCVFPLILFIIHFLLKDNLLLITLFLLTIIVTWYRFVPTQNLYLFGMFYSKLPFMLPAFLFGVMFSFLYYKKFNHVKPSSLIKNILLTISLAILIIFTFFSNGQILDNSKIYAFIYRAEFGFCAALLIFLFLFTGCNFLTRIFSNFFLTSIGVVSYSLYLIHPLIINLLGHAHFTGGLRFIAALILSYFFSCFTYHLIEKPFFKKT